MAKHAIELLRELAPDAVLRAALASNLEQYNRGDIKNRNAAGIKGIMALADFALSCGATSPALLKPVRELVGKLGDLMLAEKSEKGGRTRASTQRELLKEIVAVAVSILIDGGMDDRDANKYIARKLDRIGLHRSSLTIGNWRSTVMANLPCNVGMPGTPDQPKTTAPENPDVGLYLLRWRQWRALGKPQTAQHFVDRKLVPDMTSFLD